MKALRNVYDRSVPSRNLWTTIPGLITLVLSILVGLGVISFDQQGELQTHITTIYEASTAIYGAIIGIILTFKAKD